MADPKDLDELEAWKALHYNVGASIPAVKAELDRVAKQRSSVLSAQRLDLIPKPLREAEGKGGEAEKTLREAKREAGLCTDKFCYTPREDLTKARCTHHLIDRRLRTNRRELK